MKIVITEAEGLRLMQFDTPWVQGAMRLDDPDRLALDYAERMFAWLPLHEIETLPRRHLVTLGLGAGSLTRFAHRVLGMQATAVEIEPDVIEACRRHFLLPADGDGLRVVHGDGGDFVSRQAAHTIDVLQVDAYDASVERPALDTELFYAACRRALREGGTLVANLIGRSLHLRRSIDRLRAGLRPTATWQFPHTDGGNAIVVAHLGPMPPEDLLRARAAEVERRWGLPASGWLAMVRRWQAAA